MPSGFSEDFTGKHGRPAAAPVNTLVTSPEGQSCFLSGASQGPLHFFKFVPHDLVGYITDSLTALKEPISFTPFSRSLSKSCKMWEHGWPGVQGARPGGEAHGGLCVVGQTPGGRGPCSDGRHGRRNVPREGPGEGRTQHPCDLVKKCHSSALGDVNCASWESRAGQTLAGSHLCKGTPRTPFVAWSPPHRGPENLGVSGSALLTMKPLQTAA